MSTELHLRRELTILLTAVLLAGAACAPAAAPTTAPTTQATSAPSQATAAPTGGGGGGAGTGGGPATGKAIPLCVAVAQTSNTALLGQEEVVGAKIAEKFFNDRGGVNGSPIQIFYEDTAGDEAGAINAFQTCINKDKVVGIVGPTLSQQAFAADPIADKAHVPVLAPSNTAAGIPQIGDYIARVSAPVAVVAPNAVRQALAINPNIKNVAVAFAQNDAFSKSETGTFQRTITDTLKLNLTTVQQFQTTDTDFTTQVTNILNTKPDLVIISGLASDGGNLVKQLRDLGYKGLIIGGNGLNTANIFPVCQAACDGVLIAQAYSPELDSDMNRQFGAAVTADQKKPGTQFNAQTFTAVQVFVEALKAVDAKTKIASTPLEKLREDLNTQILAGKYDTPLGAISFDKEGEILQSKFYVAQIKMNADGKTGAFTFLK